MNISSVVLAGTSKGLIVLRQSDEQWHPVAVHFEGLPISMTFIDERNGTWWVAVSHRHWGEKLHRSLDEGVHWEEVSVPSFKGYSVGGKPAHLRHIWVMQHGGYDRPDELWLGAEPAALFHSNDSGNSFQMADALWNLPGRQDIGQWFGAGKDDPFLHTIIVDPRDSRHVYVAVSCAGVFETHDGGDSWQPRNRGLLAAYLPFQFPEVGHDPHAMLLCKDFPNVIWQQNHCGIFRTTDGGHSWDEVSGVAGLPKYGFALAIDEHDPEQAWVIPALSDEMRIPANLKLAVYHTQDGGNSWQAQCNGLPDYFVFDMVLRHAFVKCGNSLLFGTNNGNLYTSYNCGDAWKLSTAHLAPVYSLTASPALVGGK